MTHTDGTGMRSLRTPLTCWYALQPPEEPAEKAPDLLIALHGYGQNAPEFIEQFRPLARENLLVAAPQAPHAFYLKSFQGRIGFSWMTSFERNNAIADVNLYLHNLTLEIVHENGIDPDRVFLLGFSQGGPVSLRFALSGLHPVAGVILCATDVAPDSGEQMKNAPPDFPIRYAFASDDPVLPPDIQKVSEERLAAASAHYTTHAYTGGHTITPGLLADIADWTKAVS